MKKELNKKDKVKRQKISSASLKSIPEKEKDYLAAILEEMRSDFRAFGESLDFVRKKGDETFEEVGKMKVEMEETNFRLDSIELRLSNIEQEVTTMRNDINFLKSILTQKADIEYLKKLEVRLMTVERHLKLAQ